MYVLHVGAPINVYVCGTVQTTSGVWAKGAVIAESTSPLLHQSCESVTYADPTALRAVLSVSLRCT